jgi:ABC-2 type transport system ATP-binding protein
MSEATIQLRGLTKRFGPFTAVKSLSLEVAAGEVFGLVGPDGAGKTTTLRMICGLMEPSEGTAVVAGFDVARNPDAVKDRIGYMAQRFGLYADLTVEENMMFYADLFGLARKDREELTPRLLAMTRMEPFRDRLAGRLSGGMKQKLALMCTLLHRPRILFLDEPTNGVDPLSRRDFWVILYELVRDGITVFVTTAYLDEAERCNRVGLMDQGTLIECESPQRLKEQLPVSVFEVRTPNPRSVRGRIAELPGVIAVEPAGSVLHAFVEPGAAVSLTGVTFERITPSLEDVFIAHIRRVRGAAQGVNG